MKTKELVGTDGVQFGKQNKEEWRRHHQKDGNFQILLAPKLRNLPYAYLGNQWLLGNNSLW